ncbi:hypothetical protein AT52_00981 [Streptococcus equi subsp. zooepidemicus Sz35]|uniref:hypothetical protein n=1 Tax=Streptococcus equi TaxID=1336 RepID=UPI0002D653FB|nr:hypothetical protein [Streptococcus equi]AIA69013.1 hypothetical protein Q426_10445 [Streptococcus equi subsp. zooepidemicus CY]KIS18107.1 hypothetical protein AT52_00981 [Streptococcus equi subsp. zooepidemicus Sz35]MBR7684750.1 hypothetical protein [Streptococcus equi subsp. zooepidemicus]MBR7753473.1 hypothetical protein [Streptococcus equi subsp. zooepidemicus]MBR7776450.1 hypothetical protein [Streptococcus equi subsp. zooepidemicus]
MITDLKQKLRELRANRLINYGNTAYQRVSNDWHFENVPTELRELWYSRDVVSFITLSIAYDSDIDQMSHNELVRWIDNECCLMARLENIFSNLEKQKVGNAHGKN